MPIVGIRSSRVICAASSRGTPQAPLQTLPPLPPPAHPVSNAPLHPPFCPARETRPAHSTIAASTLCAPSPEFRPPSAVQSIPAAARRLPLSPLPPPRLSQIAWHCAPIP